MNRPAAGCCPARVSGLLCDRDQNYYNSKFNDRTPCPYVTIAASLSDPPTPQPSGTHWDAVSELWVAMLLAAPHTARAIALNMATVVGEDTSIRGGGSVGTAHIWPEPW